MFQIFAQLLEVRPPGSPIPEAYHAIFPPLLTPTFWERSGNVPALVRLLQAYLARAGPDVVSRGYLQASVGSAAQGLQAGRPPSLQVLLPPGLFLRPSGLLQRRTPRLLLWKGSHGQDAWPDALTRRQLHPRTRLALAQAVLGVFQKLIASKAHDHEGFYILNTLIESLDYQGTMAQVRAHRLGPLLL